METARLLACGVLLITALYLLQAVLPFVVLALALIGAWYLWQHGQRR